MYSSSEKHKKAQNYRKLRSNAFVIFVEIERKNKDVSSQDETSLSIQS
jgi:hypothetical protein